MHMNRNIDS